MFVSEYDEVILRDYEQIPNRQKFVEDINVLVKGTKCKIKSVRLDENNFIVITVRNGTINRNAKDMSFCEILKLILEEL